MRTRGVPGVASILSRFGSRAIALLIGAWVTSIHAALPDAEIVSLEGRGEYREAQQAVWNAAKIRQALVAGQYVRTADLSRMGILFPDRTQLRLGQNSTIQIKQVAKESSSKTVIDLNAGRSWVQSKTVPQGLVMQTPSALAAVRGTDWEMAVDADGTSTLTVLSGEIEFFNDHGSLLVGRDEQARAEKGKAPVRLFIRNPRERVQWVSTFRIDARHYPDLIAAPGNLAPVLAAMRDGDLPRALALLKREAAGPGPAVAKLLLADFATYSGDFAQATRILDEGRLAFPSDERFDVALARLALLDGDEPRARYAIREALARNGRSATALVVLGDVERFAGHRHDAMKAYIAASTIAPSDPAPWLGIGIIENARGNSRAAIDALIHAISLDDASAGALAELGSARATGLDPQGAREAYRKSRELQPDNYVALAGSGALELSQGEVDAGLDLLLGANLLEPRYAKAHLWLAAAYYRMGRVDAAREFLDRAKRADPVDPVPYLLESLIDQDRIAFIDAAADAREAMARMPFLKSLDELGDNQKGIANAGSALASVGLEYWARQLAYESYLPFWGGSHLFLADRYPGEFDRRSELMQGFITDPLAFGASNRFQSLYRSPGNYATLSYRVNTNDEARLREPTATFNGQVAGPMPLAYFLEAIDSRIDPGNSASSAHGRNFTAGLGWRPTYELGVFLYANRLAADTDIGKAGVTGERFLIDGSTNRVDGGVRYSLNADNSIWIKAGGGRDDSHDAQVSSVFLPSYTLTRATDFTTRPSAADLQVRQTVAWDPQTEITWGAMHSTTREPRTLVRDSTLHFVGTPSPPESFDGSDHDRHDNVQVRVRYGREAWRLEAGLGYSDYAKDRNFDIRSADAPLEQFSESYRHRTVEPELGAVGTLSRDLVARAACRRWTRGAAPDTLMPVAGSGIAFDDQLVFAGGRQEQCRGQLEWTISSAGFAYAFAETERVSNLASPRDGVLNTRADVTNLDRLRNRILAPPPRPDALEETPVFAEGTVRRAGVAIEAIATRSLALRADYVRTVSDVTTTGYDGNDIPYLPRQRANLSLTWTPGWRSYLTILATYRTQRYADEANTVVIPSGWDAQFNAYIESQDKRWSLQLTGANLLKKQTSDLFGAVVSLRF